MTPPESNGHRLRGSFDLETRGWFRNNWFGSRRRQLFSIGACLLIGLPLAGCGSAADTPGAEPQTITLSVPVANTTQTAYQDLAKQYMDSHPGVTIKVDALNLSSYNSTLTTQLQAGSGPDVFYVNPGSGETASVTQLGRAGQLMELTDQSTIDVVPDNAKDLFTVDGKAFAVPVDLVAAGIIYNDQAARAAGVALDATSSFDDLLAQCSKARAQGKAVLAGVS